MPLHITQALSALLLRQAAAALPQECCGLLLGSGDQIMALIPTPNVAAAPQHNFEVSPIWLLDAHRIWRQRLIGSYHSHPTGTGKPSARDAAGAHEIGKIWLIVAQGGVHAYTVRAPGRFDEQALIISQESRY